VKTQAQEVRPDAAPLALRVREAVAISGLSRASLYKLLAAEKLRDVRVCGRRLFLREDIVALLHGAADARKLDPEKRTHEKDSSVKHLSQN